VTSQDDVRELLCELGDTVRDAVLAARDAGTDMARVARQDISDTIYGIDVVAEAVVHEWLLAHWPADLPARVVLEGSPEFVVPRCARARSSTPTRPASCPGCHRRRPEPQVGR
jgi:hypothetical protein